jgi:Na+/H+ antiporter NhaD/arsenite permease-like protein
MIDEPQIYGREDQAPIMYTTTSILLSSVINNLKPVIHLNNTIDKVMNAGKKQLDGLVFLLMEACL